MNPRTTVILLGVALVLGVFTWFYEIRGGALREQADAAAKRLFQDLEADDIDSLSVEAAGETPVRVEKIDGRWRLVAPLSFPADEAVVSGMASSLAQLASQGTIEEPADADVYGLGAGALVIRFRADGIEHRLRIGNETPVDSHTYVSTGEGGGTFTVEGYEANRFRRSLDDLRERRLLRFDRMSIDRIDASWPGGSASLERGESGWRLVAPIEDAADEQTVADLLSDLGFLRAESFVDAPTPDDLATLDEPRYVVDLSTAPAEESGGPLHFQLTVGSEDANRQHLARAAEASLYRIGAPTVEKLPATLSAFRFKTLTDFEPSEARRFQLVFRDGTDAETTTIEVRREESGWVSEPEPMDPDKAASLIAELSRLRAADILAESMGDAELAGLDLAPARVTVRVFGEPSPEGDEELLAEIHLGRADFDRGIAATAAGDAKVYSLDFARAAALPVSLDAFRQRFLVEEDAQPGVQLDSVDDLVDLDDPHSD